MASRLLLAGLALVLILVACSSQVAPPADNPRAAAPAVEDPPHPAPADPIAVDPPGANPAAMLAQRTASHSQSIEAILARRAGADPAPSSASSQLLDPDAFRLSPVIWPSGKPSAGAGEANPPALSLANQAATAGPTVAPAAPAEPVRLPTQTSDELHNKLARQIQETPKDLCAQLDYQILQLIRDEQGPSLSMISSLSDADRELVAAIVDCLANFRNGVRQDANMLSNKKIRPIVELADRLRAQADLRLPTLALCTRVDAFGVYEPIDPPRFTAGREHQAIIYCEVENFASHFTADRKWETRLTQEAVLYTETGMPVWQDKSKPIVDQSRNRRHDFYLVRKLTLPAMLPINRYILKVSVVDQQANRVAEATLPIQVIAP